MKSKNWLAFACLALVSVIYTWPLLTHLTTAIPGTANDSDVATMVWNVGWVQHVLNTGGDLLSSDAVFAPFTVDLRLHTYGLLQGLLAYPFTGILGVVGAYNLILILTLFINGASLYVLVYSETQHRLSALIAAIWAMLGTPLLFQISVGRPTFGSIWIVCLALWVMRRLLDEPRLWSAITLGMLLLAALLTDFQIVLFSALWLMLYGIYRLARDRRRIVSVAHVGGLGLAVLIFGIPFMTIFYPALAGGADAGYPQPTLTSMMLYSFRLADYVTPGVLELVYGYELAATALIAIVIFRWRGGYRFWLAGGLVMLVLALGPYFQPVSGDDKITLPFAILGQWQPLRNFRTPYRLTIPALIGLGVVAGYVLASPLPRIRARGVLALVAIGGRLVFAIYHDPFHIQLYPEYAIYREIAAEPGDFLVLEVPFGVRTGLDHIGDGGEILQYYQHIHHKRLINGMIARLPRSMFEFYREHPSLMFLSGELPRSDAVDQNFIEMMNWSEARYVLVHTAMLSARDSQQIQVFLDSRPQLEQSGTEGDLIIYEVISPAELYEQTQSPNF